MGRAGPGQLVSTSSSTMEVMRAGLHPRWAGGGGHLPSPSPSDTVTVPLLAINTRSLPISLGPTHWLLPIAVATCFQFYFYLAAANQQPPLTALPLLSLSRTL